MSPRLTDALLALGLAAAMLVQLVLADEPGATAVGIVGALAVTLPLAWRRRAPLAVVLTSVGAALAQELLGGGLYSGQPPLAAAIVAGGVAFYSLGAHAPERRAATGFVIGVAGLWATVVATGDTDVQSFLFSGGLVATAPWLAGRSTRARALRLAAVEREREQRALTAVSEERAGSRASCTTWSPTASCSWSCRRRARGASSTRIRSGRGPRWTRSRRRVGRRSPRCAPRSGMLRDEGEAAELQPQPTLGDLDDLVAEMREAGLGVDLTVAGAPASSPSASTAPPTGSSRRRSRTRSATPGPCRRA